MADHMCHALRSVNLRADKRNGLVIRAPLQRWGVEAAVEWCRRRRFRWRRCLPSFLSSVRLHALGDASF